MKTKYRRNGLSIVLKVSILAGSIAALASFVVGTLIVRGSAEIVFENALNRLKYETNIKSLNLVSDINNLSGDTQYLAGTPPIMGIPRAIKNGGIDPLDQSDLSTWQVRLSIIFTELIRAKPNYLQIRYIGIADHGKELIRIDRKGSVISPVSGNELQSKGHKEYFKNALRLQPGEVYLSDISLNREYHRISEPFTPVIRAATPIYFEDKLFGILVINMAFGEIFNDLIKETPRELSPYVINEEGYFLAHPNKDMTYGFDRGNEYKIQETYQDFDLKSKGDLRDLEFTIEANGDVAHVVKTYFDPFQKDRYFAVMLATSYENLQSGSIDLKQQSFLIMALLVTISLIIAGLLASKLMYPVQLISIASEDLARGREVLNLPVNRNDEIGDLARSFDKMRHQLEDKKRELILSQARVHHANKMSSLGEMAANMAHEINSPIQAISFIAQRVQRQLKNNMPEKDIDASMEKITGSVTKISEIIDSLRKLSRESVDDDFLDIGLCDLVEDVINMTEERFKVNNIDFEVNYHDISENSLIQCQRLQITQVLINLINNAYDAIQTMDKKWIKVDIRKLTDKMQISVTDSGTGIAKDIVEKIFEPLFTTKDIGHGTGLGLNISREIILKHNGIFYVDERSVNTCFVLELPIVQLVN